MILNDRIDKNEWFLELAEVASKRSEDPYKKVGAIAIRPDNSIAAVSYNGAPPNIQIDWSDRDKRRKYVIHAETNLLRYIKPHECNRVAITLSPCIDCLKNLVSYGIQEIFFSEIYENIDYQELNDIADLYKVQLTHISNSDVFVSERKIYGELVSLTGESY